MGLRVIGSGFSSMPNFIVQAPQHVPYHYSNCYSNDMAKMIGRIQYFKIMLVILILLRL